MIQNLGTTAKKILKMCLAAEFFGWGWPEINLGTWKHTSTKRGISRESAWHNAPWIESAFAPSSSKNCWLHYQQLCAVILLQLLGGTFHIFKVGDGDTSLAINSIFHHPPLGSVFMNMEWPSGKLSGRPQWSSAQNLEHSAESGKISEKREQMIASAPPPSYHPPPPDLVPYPGRRAAEGNLLTPDLVPPELH